ncbi:MAG: hypothetical protein V2A71_02010 [Candidatus Eisenbacteria bacterium]
MGQHKCRFCGAPILPFQKFEVWAIPKKVRIHSNNDYRGTKKTCAEHFRESMNWKERSGSIIERG